MADEQRGHLTYGGQTWEVETAPVFVDEDGDSILVEVWVKRGESIGKSSEG
ncbi:hypothetical protein SAM23877_6152 [Streptomyces ambofaciens ATCC 23877]|uniref:Uncharacterized protein n=1 Tax=Streptomyces ambofaciens (strain ATCC 23877 / 3486 / DSM 40053 / JCM 4204 / NBRC 12836 / NRRL B-2516) TaxID=278992 RepID=A0A0K2B282_STRA7|nr:hypothetical protein [Streptomyces ambofaciens]AKZ59197.1 hypothetical protein SAM23877_6152 [Streptomyces ambofaciens ATCC 23877]WNA15390.1 hypothetical protein SAMYPH_59 [Streptomyces phage Samy]